MKTTAIKKVQEVVAHANGVISAANETLAQHAKDLSGPQPKGYVMSRSWAAFTAAAQLTVWGEVLEYLTAYVIGQDSPNQEARLGHILTTAGLRSNFAVGTGNPTVDLMASEVQMCWMRVHIFLTQTP